MQLLVCTSFLELALSQHVMRDMHMNHLYHNHSACRPHRSSPKRGKIQVSPCLVATIHLPVVSSLDCAPEDKRPSCKDVGDGEKMTIEFKKIVLEWRKCFGTANSRANGSHFLHPCLFSPPSNYSSKIHTARTGEKTPLNIEQ
eukprot:scaffold8252_cov92-Cylindrotheca_fusiformis.AAC.4